MKVLLILNYDKQNADAAADAVIGRLGLLGCEVWMDETLLDMSRLRLQSAHLVRFAPMSTVVEQCELMVVIGGDGTILHSAKYAVMGNLPLVGVNTGRLGFLTSLEWQETHRLDQVIRGDYVLQPRMLLTITKRSPAESVDFLALNDAVILRAPDGRLADLMVYHNDQPVGDYRADGLIVATPTGSTAYSFSAGGAVIDPGLSCVAVTPICPHSLFGRTMIFPADGVLSIRRREGDAVYLTVDGEFTELMEVEDVIEISQAPMTLGLVTFKDRTFYDNLNKKMIGRR